MSSTNPLLDEHLFAQLFVTGLQKISEADTLGAFILALANANQGEALWQALLPRLRQRREELAQRFAAELVSEAPVAGLNPADLQVFRQLLDLPLESLQTTRYRHLGPWVIQANPLRALRPKRMGSQNPSTLSMEFNEEGFHFDRPFMVAEGFWEGLVDDIGLNLYYNKFPFVDGHLLLVPNKAAHWPQFHRQEMHTLLWSLCATLGAWQAHAGIAYNSVGAYASVNHLHYQMYVRQEPLPIEASHWAHNGGDVAYPLNCRVYTDPQAAWQAIEQLHQTNQPYNLLYGPEQVTVIPRLRQGDYGTANWSPGFAWYETCGGFVVEDQEAFSQLQEGDIEQALSQLLVPSSS